MASRPLLILTLACCWLLSVDATAPETGSTRLAELGIAVTAGAAPGYVPDEVCARCHAEIAASFRSLGMARSFSRPGSERWIEDFSAGPFVHAASGQSFELRRAGDGLVFRQFQRDDAGRPIHVYEQKVDWVLGSGNHARVYLYQTPNGELYQLPLAWYSQEGRWGMAPGFDRPDHQGVSRPVLRECLFCHNAYPEVPAGSDAHLAESRFPAALPQGIGCQRCHGPGAAHVEGAMGGGAPAEQVRAAIVNPARLPPERRDAVCNGCHFQPSVVVPGLRRAGLGDYSFRPGELLEDYLIPIDVEQEGLPRGERFEINHHAYRLRQSRCFTTAAPGALSCLSCHDPHHKPSAAELAARVRAVCQGCHGGEHRPALAADADCAACHLPKRRPLDVVHAVMTDHRITRQPGGAELLAPHAEWEPVLTEVEVLPSARAATDAERRRLRAQAVVRVLPTPAATRELARLLAEGGASIADELDLAKGQLLARQFNDAAATLRRIVAREPGSHLAHEWLGSALFAQGERDAALASFRRAEELGSDRPELAYNLGLALLAGDEAAAAAVQLERALAARPNLSAAWLYLGIARKQEGRMAEAEREFAKAVALSPGNARARALLDELRRTRERGNKPSEGDSYGPRRPDG